MLGKTHIPFGVTTALLVTRPSTVPGVIAAIAGGAFGAWICDIDVRSDINAKRNNDVRTFSCDDEWDDEGKDEKQGRVLGFVWMAIDVSVALIVDFLMGNGICDYMMRTFSIFKIIAIMAFFVFCVLGAVSKHRSFTHSILGGVLFSALIYFICEPLAIPFISGFISHIVLDLFNRRGIQLFFPLKKRVSFGACASDGAANRVIGGMSVISSVILTVVFVFLTLRSENAAMEFISISRQGTALFNLTYFQLYLVIINIISFIAYTIDYLICLNGYVDEDNEESLHQFLNIFAYIGGALGALIALIIFAEKGRNSANWFVVIISVLIAWIVIYIIIMDPLGMGFGAIRPSIFSHLPLVIYLLAINIVSAILFIRDRYRRRSNIDSHEFLLILVSLIGGAAGGYLVMIFTNGKQNHPHFSIGLPVLMAVHTFVIAFLLFAGIA